MVTSSFHEVIIHGEDWLVPVLESRAPQVEPDHCYCIVLLGMRQTLTDAKALAKRSCNLSQVGDSLEGTCDSVWPILACTCDNLR